MYGASLTKMVFAYTVMQLVDQGKINLDTPLKDDLDKPLPSYGPDPVFPDKYRDGGTMIQPNALAAIVLLLGFSSGFAIQAQQPLAPSTFCGWRNSDGSSLTSLRKSTRR
jgi:hypothetical protein